MWKVNVSSLGRYKSESERSKAMPGTRGVLQVSSGTVRGASARAEEA